MDRAQKEALVAEVHGKLESASVVVIGHYRGLSVAEMESLRAQMRENDAEIKVAKNRLVKIAAEGTPYINLTDLMSGPTAIATSEDPVAAARVAHKFAEKNDKFIILGGALGEKVLEVSDVEALAKMPSLDELRAKIVGLISAPAQRMATVTQEPAAKLARVIAKKPEAA